jgi:hypothetical protein
MMLIKGKKEMKVQVSSLLRKQDILLFNHNSSTFETFYSSLSSSSCNLQVSKPATPLSYYVPLTPRTRLLPPLQAWHLSSHQTEEIWSLLHPRTNIAGRLSIFPSHKPQLSTPLKHSDTLQSIEMKSFKIGLPSLFVAQKSTPMVDPTLSTKEMEVEKDEQIVMVLEKEARGGGDQIEVLGEK